MVRVRNRGAVVAHVAVTKVVPLPFAGEMDSGRKQLSKSSLPLPPFPPVGSCFDHGLDVKNTFSG